MRCRRGYERVEFLWIFMLDPSLALELRNQTVGCLWWGIAHKEEWIHGVGARAAFFLRSRSFFSNAGEERVESPARCSGSPQNRF
jgi:hypothetical protein